MKHSFLILNILCLSASTGATVRTVCNNPSTIAQFSSIQAAVDASASGDTILVHGSLVAYSAVTINSKSLTLIGPGWSPTKNIPLTAKLPSLFILGTTSSGTEIQGMQFVNGSGIHITSSHPNNLRFIRNYFVNDILINELSTTYTGYVFEGNVFSNSMSVRASGSSTYQDFIFRNNYIYNFFNGVASFYGLTNSINVLFDHNIWFGPPSGSGICFGSDCRSMVLTNNIFVRRDAAANNSFSTFNNNITFGTTTNDPWAVNGNVDGGGNLENQDPQMVDQSSVNAGVNNPLLDFTIAAGPANNSGSDGKDLGLLYDPVGSHNWNNCRNTRLPYVYSMNITNPTIASGGTLTVQVVARKGN